MEQQVEVYELPVSFAQRRIWLLDQFDPGGTAYLVPWRVDLRGPVDVDALAAALSDVVDRHETLRTVFKAIDGQPVQVVGAREVRLSFVDFMGTGDAASAAGKRVTAEARTPFDLARGPLLRATLLRLAPEEHILVLVFHHVVADGWSFGLLFDELATAYGARVAGAPAELRELPVQYGDFALWQQDRWDDGGYADDEAYWRDELAGAPLTLEVPTDHPRPPRQSYRGEVFEFAVDAELADGVRGLAQRAGATLFMTLLSTFATVVSRFTGRTDLLVGVPVAGRTRPETEHLIGLFMNTLALRARLTGDPTFAELLDQVRRTTASALAHQELPFDRVVELLQPGRSLAQSPVIQVMFALEDRAESFVAGGLTWHPSTVDNGTVKFDLTLSMADTAEGLTGRLSYDADLYTAAFAERFVASLLAVARAAVADADTRVSAIDILSTEQRETVLDAWGRGAAVGSAGDVGLRLAAALSGTETAIVAPDGELTRAETARWAGRIAAVLRGHGVGPEVAVGVCLPRSTALIPALLGVWWAGGGYVPLDPAYPAERLRVMLADSGLRVLLTHSDLAPLVSYLAGPDVTIVRVDALDADEPIQPVAVPPEALAYTIFTSGSTGRPKGVAVPRGAVDALLSAFGTGVLSSGDRLVAVTTLSFDIAVLELLLPLVCGAAVVIADGDTAADGATLRDLLVSSGATAMQATPATWRMLVATGGIPASVRVRLCGGEALPGELLDPLTADGATALNVYGPTETTVWSAAGPVRPTPSTVDIGPPIAGTRLYVLDDALRPVPPGVVGEVYLGGAGVARGYHGRPELTAGAFLPDPYADTLGARLYRTGDLGRWRTNGLVDLLGRVDHQVKIRGFRIETGEIEAVLTQHTRVGSAVVSAYVPEGSSAADAQLVAYVVPSDPTESTVDVPVLRRHLTAHLPDYMVPTAYVALPELPLTPNGKVDRTRLPAPTWGGTRRSAPAKPVTQTQVRIADLWTELLPPAEIGLHDNFFALGGHSLTATQLLARIRVMFGVQISLRALFGNPTVAELATLVEQSTAPGASAEAVAPSAAHRLSDKDFDELLQTLMPDET